MARSPAETDLAQRLFAIDEVIAGWLDTYQPEVVAIERVFSQHNVRTVMGTAQVSGVVALAAARRETPVVFHTPSEVKAAISGSGRADKKQVTTMVTRILGLAREPKPADAADALALAVCHAWRGPTANRLADAEAESARLARNHRARLRAAQQDRNSPRSDGGTGRNGRRGPQT